MPSRHVDPALENRHPGGAAVGAHGGHHRPPGREKRQLRRGSPRAATKLLHLCQLFQDWVSVILLPLPVLFLFLLKSLLLSPCIKAKSCGEDSTTSSHPSPRFFCYFFFLSPSGATSLAAAGGEAAGRRELLLVGFWRIGLHGVEGGVPVVPAAHVDLAVQHHGSHRAATSRTPGGGFRWGPRGLKHSKSAQPASFAASRVYWSHTMNDRGDFSTGNSPHEAPGGLRDQPRGYFDACGVPIPTRMDLKAAGHQM